MLSVVAGLAVFAAFVWQIGPGDPLVEFRGGAGWQPGDRWAVDAALERTAVYENVGTIDVIGLDGVPFGVFCYESDEFRAA